LKCVVQLPHPQPPPLPLTPLTPPIQLPTSERTKMKKYRNKKEDIETKITTSKIHREDERDRDEKSKT
jgi:hypothetical protein